jgi:hypothetical protein
MAGGRDAQIDLEGLRGLFDVYSSDSPHYFLFFAEAIHSAFHDVCFETACDMTIDRERVHELVNRYATAFLLMYVAGDEGYAGVLHSGEPPDAEITYAGP